MITKYENNVVSVFSTSGVRNQNKMQSITMTANRYRLMLPQINDIQKWIIVTPILKFDQPVDTNAFIKATELLLIRNDSLQIQLSSIGEKIQQYQLLQNSKDYFHIVDLTDASNNNLTYQEITNTVNEVKRNFDFSKPLITMLLFLDKNKKGYFVIVVHHVLADRHSMKLITQEFIKLYLNVKNQGVNCDETNGDHKGATSYRQYVERYMELSKEEKNINSLYWNNIDWDSAKQSNKDIECTRKKTKDYQPNGLQRDTCIIQNNIQLNTKWPIEDVVVIDGEYTLIEVIVACIARAYGEIWQAEHLFLDIAHSNRKQFGLKMDLEQTIGWFSSVFPLLIPVASSFNNCLRSVGSVMDKVIRHGNGYGDLNYGERSCEDYPVPLVSLNHLNQNNHQFNYQDIVSKPQQFDVLPRIDTEAHRPHLLSGGTIISNNSIILQWDFSSKVLDTSLVRRFAELCNNTLICYLNNIGQKTS